MIWVVAALLAVFLARAMHQEIVESNDRLPKLLIEGFYTIFYLELDPYPNPWVAENMPWFWKKRHFAYPITNWLKKRIRGAFVG